MSTDYAMKTFTKQEIIDAITEKFESVESYAEKKGVTRQAVYSKIDRADNKTSEQSKFIRQLIKEKAFVDQSITQNQTGGDSAMQNQGNKNQITNNNNGVHESIVNQLIESQREQIIFLQERVKELTAEIVLNKRTIENTLTYLANSCKECADLHKAAHKKIEQLECYKQQQKKKS